jgi:hypothetical protein
MEKEKEKVIEDKELSLEFVKGISAFFKPSLFSFHHVYF